MASEEREGRRRAVENSIRGLFTRDNISRDPVLIRLQTYRQARRNSQ
jgi:hypothetical protein